MFSKNAHAVARKRNAWLIIAVWVAVLIVSRLAPAPPTSTQQQDFMPSNDDSIAVPGG